MTQAPVEPSMERAIGRRNALLIPDTLAAWTSLPLPLAVKNWGEASRSSALVRLSVAPVDSGPGVWQYVGWGALIGGVVTGGYAAYRTRSCDGCFFTGVYIGGATAVGALLGGFVGSLIYADRYWSHTR